MLDDSIDDIAKTIPGGIGLRLPIMAAIAVIIAFNLGWTFAGEWLAAIVGIEGWIALSVRPFRRGEEVRPWHRLSYLMANVAQTAAQCAVAVAYLATHKDGLAFVAGLSLNGLIAYSSVTVSQHRLFGIALAVPPVAGLILALLVGRYAGAELVAVLLSTVITLGFALGMALAFIKTNKALEESRAEAQAANQAKSQFLATMSHELRTPMNGVLGMAQALNRTDLTDQQRGYIETILQSSDSLLTVLNDVLDHSKIEAGKVDIEDRDYDMRNLIRHVEKLWREMAIGKGLSLNVALADSVPQWVRGDSVRLRQILSNLLSNAIKFTAEGSVTLDVWAELVEGQEPRLVAEVRDTGPGMSPEVLGRLFNPFTQGDTSTTRRFGGTGLGLSISRELARRLGGDISATSEEGEGSVFRVWLPLVDGEAPIDRESDDEEAISGLRVLAAEDNLTNQAVLQAILGVTGAELTIVGDGVQALAALEREDFDLVLMDVNMPQMDGKEALRRIRNGCERLRGLPVIALTADAMSEQRRELLELGFDGHVAKPIIPAELFAVITSALEPGAPRDETRSAAARTAG